MEAKRFGYYGRKKVDWYKTVVRNGRVYAKLKVLRNTRLNSGIKFKKTDGIGNLKEIVRELNLNADRGRLWNGSLKSVKSKKVHNDSVPISMNHFTGNEGLERKKKKKKKGVSRVD